ncbi:hypothetical protein DBR42_04260, partial [Pelomonas sp. HMWF004]
YSSALGFTVQLPGLTLKLRDAAFTQTYSFGGPGDGTTLAIDVGSSATTAPAGFITLLPKQPANLGATTVYASGPAVTAGGYQLFYDGAGRSAEVPLVYNGVSSPAPAPAPEATLSDTSAVLAASESARRDRFEEAVRTDGVVIPMRAGGITETGVGRPVTIGDGSILLPEICLPTPTLRCVTAGLFGLRDRGAGISPLNSAMRGDPTYITK